MFLSVRRNVIIILFFRGSGIYSFEKRFGKEGEGFVFWGFLVSCEGVEEN